MPFNSDSFLQAQTQGFGRLAGGIMGGASSIADAIERTGAEHKKLKAFRTMAVDGLGMDTEEVDKLDLPTLEGKFQSIAIKKQMEQMQREAEDQEYERAQRTAGRQFQQRLSGLPAGAQGPPAPLTPQSILSAAGDSGYQLDPRVIAQFAKDADGVNWQDVMPREGTTPSGDRFMYGKSGQFQFSPSQFMQDAPDLEGYTMVPGKTGPRFMRNVQPKTLPDSYNSRLVSLQDQLQAAEGNAGKSDDDLKKLKMSGTKEFYTKAVTASRQAIKDHVARFEGQGYADKDFWDAERQRLGLPQTPAPKSQTPTDGRVKVTKDGKEFTVPADQLPEAEKQGYKRVP